MAMSLIPDQDHVLMRLAAVWKARGGPDTGEHGQQAHDGDHGSQPRTVAEAVVAEDPTKPLLQRPHSLVELRPIFVLLPD
jgi:hypothetical protein